MAIDAQSTVTIRHTKGWASLGLGELWAYREMIFFLAMRTVKVRYKQTVFGIAWVLIQPLTTMIIFTFIFGRLAKIPTDGIPYPVFVFAGLVPWQFFSGAVSRGADSLVGAGAMFKQVYFPRLSIPISSVGSAAVDFLIALGLLFLVAAWYGYLPNLRYLALPAFFLLAVAAAMGVSLVLSAMNVQFRDVKHALPFLMQTWMFCTSVVYPSSLVASGWKQTLFSINPMVGVIDGFRWALLGSGPLPVQQLITSATVSLALLFVGLLYFKRMERTFADVV